MLVMLVKIINGVQFYAQNNPCIFTMNMMPTEKHMEILSYFQF